MEGAASNETVFGRWILAVYVGLARRLPEGDSPSRIVGATVEQLAHAIEFHVIELRPAMLVVDFVQQRITLGYNDPTTDSVQQARGMVSMVSRAEKNRSLKISI